MLLKSHRLVDRVDYRHILVERRPVRDVVGDPVPDLYNAWICLNNPAQLNSYTTDAVAELILAFR